MPAPGSVWGANTWDVNAWAANTWEDAGDAPEASATAVGSVFMTRARSRRRRDFVLRMIAWLFPPNLVSA